MGKSQKFLHEMKHVAFPKAEVRSRQTSVHPTTPSPHLRVLSHLMDLHPPPPVLSHIPPRTLPSSLGEKRGQNGNQTVPLLTGDLGHFLPLPGLSFPFC